MQAGCLTYFRCCHSCGYRSLKKIAEASCLGYQAGCLTYSLYLSTEIEVPVGIYLGPRLRRDELRQVPG
jgi:hypothetical protein